SILRTEFAAVASRGALDFERARRVPLAQLQLTLRRHDRQSVGDRQTDAPELVPGESGLVLQRDADVGFPIRRTEQAARHNPCAARSRTLMTADRPTRVGFDFAVDRVAESE